VEGKESASRPRAPPMATVAHHTRSVEGIRWTRPCSAHSRCRVSDAGWFASSPASRRANDCDRPVKKSLSSFESGILRFIQLDERFNWVPPAVGTAFLSGSSFSFHLASPGSPTRGRGFIRGDGSTATEYPLHSPPLHFSAVRGFYPPGDRGRAALHSDSLHVLRAGSPRSVALSVNHPDPHRQSARFGCRVGVLFCEDELCCKFPRRRLRAWPTC